MQLTISKQKLKTIILMIILIAFQYFAIEELLKASNVLNVDSNLVVASIICCISLLIKIIIWIKISKTLIDPYMIFFIVLFIFTCGQCIGWATGLNLSDKDLWDRVDHGLNRLLLLKGVLYTMISLSFFHLGGILGNNLSEKKHSKKIWTEDQVVRAYKKIGKLLLIFCIPAFAIKTAQDLIAVAIGGYSNYYVVNAGRSLIMSLFSIMADYYQPCMLILFIAYRKNKTYRRGIVVAMLFDVAATLYIGGRSGAVMILLGILLAYYYFIKPFSVKQMIMGGAIGYVVIAFMNGLAKIRGMSGRGLSDFISVLGSSFSNVIGNFIGELGWTMTSICWTMNMVPSDYPFRYGMSYLVAITSWIPSFVFGGKVNHPAVIWSNLSDWLAEAQHMTYGPGYTMVAESYINFGWLGVIPMLIEGFIIAKIIAKVSHKNVSKDMFGATFQILIIMIVMKALVRASLSVALRSCVFTLLPLYIVMKYFLKKGDGIQ